MTLGGSMRAHWNTNLAVGLALALASLTLLALAPKASADQGQLLGYAKSSSMTANTTNVINGTPQPGTLLPLNGAPLVVRSISLGTINAGETIKALAEVEVTNDLVTQDGAGTNQYHDVATEVSLVLAGSPTATAGIEIAEAQETFVTPEVHHWTFQKSGTLDASQQLSNRYLNLVMRAHSPENLTACWTFPRSSLPNPQQPRTCGMDVNYNRGHLSVLRFGPPGVAPPSAEPFSLAHFSGQSLPQASPTDAPITYAGQAPEFIVALSRPVGALEEGDILTAYSEMEVDATELVRSDVSCNVGVATKLYLSPDPDSLENAIIIGNEGGNNLTGRGTRAIKTLERGVVPSSTTVRLDQDYAGPMYVLLRLWTIGNSACAAFGNGIRADLDQAASFMHVVRYRPEADAGLVSSASNSGDDSELAGGLDVVGEDPVSVYSQPVSDLAPGDTLEALSEVQVETSDHRAAVHSTFVLADDPSDTSGTPLQADNLTEVNPYMGKLPIHDSTAWTVPGGFSGSGFVNLVMRGEHLQTLGTAPDDEIEITPDAGRLVVQHLRPVDDEPPDTSITAGPAGPTGDPTPEFAFTSSEQNSSFQCRLDSSEEAQFLPCDSPHTIATLAEGPHTFEARATDRAGNVDPLPVGRVFTVDTTPPGAPVISGSDPASPANRNNPALWGVAEPGSYVRLYRSSACQGAVEAQGTAAAFAAGIAVTVPDDLTTQFSATATDVAGNTSACASPHAYTEDSTPPQTTIVSGQRGKKTKKRTASFGFDASEAGARFECSLDGAPFAPCGSPQGFAKLGRGAHEFRVLALDASGNRDPSPARRSWKVTRKPKKKG